MGESHIGGVVVWPGAHGLDCHMIIHAYDGPYVGPSSRVHINFATGGITIMHTFAPYYRRG